VVKQKAASTREGGDGTVKESEKAEVEKEIIIHTSSSSHNEGARPQEQDLRGPQQPAWEGKGRRNDELGPKIPASGKNEKVKGHVPSESPAWSKEKPRGGGNNEKRLIEGRGYDALKTMKRKGLGAL